MPNFLGDASSIQVILNRSINFVKISIRLMHDRASSDILIRCCISSEKSVTMIYGLYR